MQNLLRSNSPRIHSSRLFGGAVLVAVAMTVTACKKPGDQGGEAGTTGQGPVVTREVPAGGPQAPASMPVRPSDNSATGATGAPGSATHGSTR